MSRIRLDVPTVKVVKPAWSSPLPAPLLTAGCSSCHVSSGAASSKQLSNGEQQKLLIHHGKKLPTKLVLAINRICSDMIFLSFYIRLI
jgi:hypothetical protein